MSYTIVGVVCFVLGALADHFLENKIRTRIADSLKLAADKVAKPQG